MVHRLNSVVCTDSSLPDRHPLSLDLWTLAIPTCLLSFCLCRLWSWNHILWRAGVLPPEPIDNLIDNWRIKSVVTFGAAYLALWVIANVTNLNKESPDAGWFVLAVMGLFYGTALIVGWDAGRSKVTIEKYDSVGFGRESTVLDILENTSRERAFSFLIVTVLISVASGVTFGWGMAITTFFGIVTFVEVMLKFAGRID